MEGRPEFGAQPFFVAVAVLRDDRHDGGRATQGEVPGGRGAVVEDVDGVALDGEGVEERFDRLAQVGERVLVPALVGDLGETETGQIWSDDAVFLG